MKSLKSIERLIDSLTKLPSVGRKSAERMVYSLLNMPKEDIEEFAHALLGLKIQIHQCPKCGMLIDEDTCPICDDPNRNKETILVVSNPKDVFALENSKSYNGLYHVLNGEISVSKGKMADELNINSLIERVNNTGIKEVILATNPTIDGETTALYISKLLSPSGVKITRLAYGLQMGGNLDYTDQLTLQKAIEGRREI